MNDQFYIKRGDTLPPLKATILESDGVTPVNLTGMTVNFAMRDKAGNLILDRQAEVTDYLNGKVSYEWQSGDTDTAGTMLAEFEASAGSSVFTAPNDGYIKVVITEDVR